MTARSFLTIAAALVAVLGLVWLLVPSSMLAGWGMTPAPSLVYMSRRYGALFLGYAATFWLVRSLAPSPPRRAIMVGALVVTTVMAALSLLGVLTHAIGTLGLLSLAVEVTLSVGFGYFVFVASDS